tara:strand:- start:2192 stop:2794 length:603 start_codon:yes stop_codon:yes gene_type:complete
VDYAQVHEGERDSDDEGVGEGEGEGEGEVAAERAGRGASAWREWQGETRWVQCERCDKWRRLPPGCAAPEDDEAWWCALNPMSTHNRCEVPEESLDEGEQHVVGEALGPDDDDDDVDEGEGRDDAATAAAAAGHELSDGEGAGGRAELVGEALGSEDDIDESDGDESREASRGAVADAGGGGDDDDDDDDDDAEFLDMLE